MPYVIKKANNRPIIEIKHMNETKTFEPAEISAAVLTKLVQAAEQQLNDKVTHAVITVPAYFNNSQRQATIDAGKIANLKVLAIINEPTAAALAYAMKMKEKVSNTCKILMFDLGGGTFDVTILEKIDKDIKVISTDGDTALGGQNIDIAMMNLCLDKFAEKNNIERALVQSNIRAVNRLRKACESAKERLSDTNMKLTDIYVDALYDGIDLTVKMKRDKFNELNEELYQKTLKIVEQALDLGKLNKKDIDHIVLFGGSTQIPKLQELLRAFFDGKELIRSINVDEAGTSIAKLYIFFS